MLMLFLHETRLPALRKGATIRIDDRRPLACLLKGSTSRDFLAHIVSCVLVDCHSIVYVVAI